VQEAAARGLSVIVIDRRLPFHGSTAASMVLLQFEIDTPLIRLAETIGFESAKLSWLRCFRAVDDLAVLVRKLRLLCAFRPRQALYLSGNTLDASALADGVELEAKALVFATGYELADGVPPTGTASPAPGLSRR
jgi:glycine/D-amino acid oxidase-like deaminating enzyme